jgi:hypothetical protein
MFTREFLQELDDKNPLSAALEGYQHDLTRLLQAAAPDITAWLQPEIKRSISVPLSAYGPDWASTRCTEVSTGRWSPRTTPWRRIIRSFPVSIAPLESAFVLLKSYLDGGNQADSTRYDVLSLASVTGEP